MAKVKPPKPFNNGQWTHARMMSFVRSALRKASTKWPPKHAAMNKHRRPYKGPNKRQKYEVQCQECKQWKMLKEVQADHIVECGSLNSFSDLPGFVERLLCEAEGFMPMCKECHKKKTNANRKSK